MPSAAREELPEHDVVHEELDERPDERPEEPEEAVAVAGLEVAPHQKVQELAPTEDLADLAPSQTALPEGVDGRERLGGEPSKSFRSIQWPYSRE